MKLRTIKKQLIISFLVISLFLIGSLTLIYSRLTEEHFTDNIKERQEEIYDLFAGNVSDILKGQAGVQARERLSSLSEAALENQFYFTVNAGGGTIWSFADIQEREQAKTFLQQLSQGHKLATTTRPLQFPADGVLEISYLDPQPYRDHDLMFIDSMNHNIFLIGILALLSSVLAATWIAGLISRPFVRIRNYTEGLTRGDYKPLAQETSILEISSVISSLNYLSQELEYQDEYRKQLTGDIAHELRTPLASVLGNLEAMIDGVWDLSRERLKSCADEIQRLSRLIGNLERINELESKQAKLDLTNLSLRAETEKVVANFSGRIEEKKLSVQINGPSGVIRGDMDQITQVLSNLLSNAIKFTPPGGRIRFDIQEEGGRVRLVVADNGIGIAQAQLPHIFRRFFMADPSRRNNEDGQGIGLSVVKSILEAHQAAIRVESKTGSGTKFIIDFKAEPQALSKG